MSQLERDIQRDVLRALALEPRVLVLSPSSGRGFVFAATWAAERDVRLVLWRQNTGAAKVLGARGRERLMRFGVPGLPDLLGIGRDGRLVALEIKTARGRLSADQEAFGAFAERFGARVAVVRSAEEARAVVRRWAKEM